MQLPITLVNVQDEKLKNDPVPTDTFTEKLTYLIPPWLGLLAKVTCILDAEADTKGRLCCCMAMIFLWKVLLISGEFELSILTYVNLKVSDTP